MPTTHSKVLKGGFYTFKVEPKGKVTLSSAPPVTSMTSIPKVISVGQTSMPKKRGRPKKIVSTQPSALNSAAPEGASLK